MCWGGRSPVVPENSILRVAKIRFGEAASWRAPRARQAYCAAIARAAGYAPLTRPTRADVPGRLRSISWWSDDHRRIAHPASHNDPGQSVLDLLDAVNVCRRHAQRCALPIVGERARQCDDTIRNRDVDRANRRPSLLGEVRQQVFANRRIAGRLRGSGFGGAHERPHEILARDDADHGCQGRELLVLQSCVRYVVDLYNETRTHLSLDKGFFPWSSGPTTRGHGRFAHSVGPASLLREDMIFGTDRGCQAPP